VQLKYVAASEMRRILEPMAPRGAIVRADDARHTLTLSGNNAEIAGLMEAISVFDVEVMRGMSFALVPVKMSDPGGAHRRDRRRGAAETMGSRTWRRTLARVPCGAIRIGRQRSWKRLKIHPLNLQ